MKSEMQKNLDSECYNCTDPEILAVIRRARKLTHKLNYLDVDAVEEHEALLRELFGKMGRNVCVDTPLHCDYGCHMTIGDNCIIGMNCTFVDNNRITLGNNVMIACDVQLCTATHPVPVNERILPNWSPKSGIPFFKTYSRPITIEDNVWLGAKVVVLPGVTIGANSVIGAGSVVNKSIPPNSVAVGNPCRVIRSLPEAQND